MKWAQKNKNTILWALTIIVIILIIIFSKPGDKNREEGDMNTGSEVSNETGSGLEVAPEMVAAEDGNVYDFSGIQWEFDTPDASNGQTLLKMRFADFTRNGSAITFSNPYKLGFHPGTCQEVDFIDTTTDTGIPLSYVQCTDGMVTRDIVVLQEAQTIMVKYSDSGEGIKPTGLQELYTLNLTNLGLTPLSAEMDATMDVEMVETEMNTETEVEVETPVDVEVEG